MGDYSVVVGLGKTGYSSIHYLRKKNEGVIAFDTRLDPPFLASCRRHHPEVTVYLGVIPAEIVANAKSIILSPGVSKKENFLQAAHNANVPVIGDIEIFAEHASAPIIGITGTNAKSTVTTLLGEMAKASAINTQVGGNLGYPVLEMLHALPAELYILELSSFQLETTYSLRLKVATILNVSPDHLDRYDSYQDYIAAKQLIYRNAQNIVFNRDDIQTLPPLDDETTKWSFGLTTPAMNEYEFGLCRDDGAYYLCCGQEKLIACDEIKIQGRHNWTNALAALALAKASGIKLAAALQTLRDFPGLTHRCQWVATVAGVSFYNDSKGTNIGASVAALEGLAQTCSGKVVLIAGGQGKKQDFSEMRQQVADYTRAVILLGEDATMLQQAWQGTVPIHQVNSMQEAVKLAKNVAQQNDAVLLSPACASFDMFNNYEHRGEVFYAVGAKFSMIVG